MLIYNKPTTKEHNEVAQRMVLWRKDWARFGREVLGLEYTPDQTLALHEFRRNKRTAVKSGHGVGKTLFSAAAALTCVSLYQCQLIGTSSSQFQVRNRFWAEFKKLYRAAKATIGGELTETMLWFDDKWFATAVATNDPDNIQGGHDANMVVVADEAQGIDAGIWDAIESMMGSRGSKSLFLFNPLYTTGPSFELSRHPDKYRLLTFSCLNHPNVLTGQEIVPGAVSRKWVEDRREAWGEDSPLYQARVLGNYPTRSVDTIFGLDELVRAAEAEIPSEACDGARLGIDVARSGADDTSYVVTVDREMVYEESQNGWDNARVAGRARQLMDEYDIPPRSVSIDANGVGAGVVDIMRSDGLNVIEVQVGGGPMDDWSEITRFYKFVNRRAELYWIGRELVMRRLAKIPRKYEDVWADLMCPKYEVVRDGKILVESKDQLKKRLGRSPNKGDAWLYSLARAGAERPSISLVG